MCSCTTSSPTSWEWQVKPSFAPSWRGERDAATLARLRDRRIKAEEAEVAAAVQGHWRDEHVFALKQALALIDTYAVQITECDGKLQHLLANLRGHELPEDGLGAPKRGTPAKNS